MDRPKLRRVERYPLSREGESLLVVRDPLDLVEPFAIDARYAAVLDALDGSKTLAQVRQSLLLRGLADVEGDDLHEFVDELGEQGLLDDDRFRARWAEVHAEFEAAETREPRRAGLLYPDDPDELADWLAPALPSRASAGFVAAEPEPRYAAPPIAVIVPHQPPPSVAGLLRPLLAALPEPETWKVIVVLATDHAPGLLPFAASDKDQQTLLGPLRCHLPLIDELEQRVPWLLREQIRQRSADAIEWTTLLLRALWGDRCPPVLPVLCGQTMLTRHEGREQADELLGALELLLGEDTAAGRVLWWAAAELAHAGPAFGHAELPNREDVEARDLELLEPLLAGRTEQLVRRCMDAPASQRPSGTAALATLVQMLPIGHRASLIGHQVIPAPGEIPGWIGCAGVIVRNR
ncbi:MEMO1 family protein [Nannocystaceae bacterium ST9]